MSGNGVSDEDPRPAPPPAAPPARFDAGAAARAWRAERKGELPPHSFEAEMALLGTLLCENRAFERVGDFLEPDHFADGRHSAIYAAIRQLIVAGRLADPITLKDHFEGAGSLATIGGTDYLARLAAATITVINAEDYGRTIFDHWLRREAIAAAEGRLEELWRRDLDLPPAEVIAALEADLWRLTPHGGPAGGPVDLDAVLAEAVARADAAFRADGAVVGVPTGLHGLDRLLGGLQPGDDVVVGGRPAMGKSDFAWHVAQAAAADGWGVFLASPDMPGRDYGMRFLAARTGVTAHAQRTGALELGDIQRLVDAQQSFAGLPVAIDDTPALRPSQLRLRARRVARKMAARAESGSSSEAVARAEKPFKGLGLLVVDYLQLMRPETNWRDDRVEAVSELSRDVKAIGKELGVPVVKVCQLSRAVEQRSDKRPILADLRQSGQIEQDATHVLFPYRHYYYLQRAEPPAAEHDEHRKWETAMAFHRDRVEVIVAKNRSGPCDTVPAFYDPALSTLGELGAEYGAAPEGAAP